MNRTNTLTLGKAYIVDGKPMVLHTIENGRFMVSLMVATASVALLVVVLAT